MDALQIYNQKKNPDSVLVSICCVTFNHEKYIRKCLDGFVMQKTNFAIEILVHEDASTDTTATIVKEYELNYPHLFRCVYQTENQFYNQNTLINILFKMARGKYIALCEGDDYWTDPFKLQSQVNIMEGNPKLSLCCHGFEVLYDQIKILKKFHLRRKLFNKGDFEFKLNDLIGWGTQTLTMLFRVSMLEIELLQKYEYCRDVHIYYHLLKNGNGFFIEKKLGVYRHHEKGIHSKIGLKRQREIKLGIYKELFEINKDTFCASLLFTAYISLVKVYIKEKKYGSITIMLKNLIFLLFQTRHGIGILNFYMNYIVFYFVNRRYIREKS